MKIPELISKLEVNHRGFVNYINSLEKNSFLAAPDGKWTAGQQLDHIRRSTKPLALAFGLPKFVPRLLFGKTNRPSRTYKELVERYQEKLAAGGQAPGRFVPPAVRYQQRDQIGRSLLKNLDRLTQRTRKYSEEELDTYILPHPLLGKLTLREMLYFTIYHVEHHRLAVERNLE